MASLPVSKVPVAAIDVLRDDARPDDKLVGSQTIDLTKGDQSKPNPKSGAVQLEWNKTGSLLLVRFGKKVIQRAE